MFLCIAREASDARSITPTDTSGKSRDRLFTVQLNHVTVLAVYTAILHHAVYLCWVLCVNNYLLIEQRMMLVMCCCRYNGTSWLVVCTERIAWQTRNWSSQRNGGQVGYFKNDRDKKTCAGVSRSVLFLQQKTATVFCISCLKPTLKAFILKWYFINL